MFPDGVPVRIMLFSASDSPEKALNVEIATENEIRRDYSRDEVLAIAERLKQAGFEEFSMADALSLQNLIQNSVEPGLIEDVAKLIVARRVDVS